MFLETGGLEKWKEMRRSAEERQIAERKPLFAEVLAHYARNPGDKEAHAFLVELLVYFGPEEWNALKQVEKLAEAGQQRRREIQQLEVPEGARLVKEAVFYPCGEAWSP